MSVSLKIQRYSINYINKWSSELHMQVFNYEIISLYHITILMKAG